MENNKEFYEQKISRYGQILHGVRFYEQCTCGLVSAIASNARGLIGISQDEEKCGFKPKCEIPKVGKVISRSVQFNNVKE